MPRFARAAGAWGRSFSKRQRFPSTFSRPRSIMRRYTIVRGARGGFFKDVFKGVKKAVQVVGRIPVIGAVARTVVSSVPVLGGVVTAVGAVKSAVHPPSVANTANTSATTGAPPVGQPQASPSGSGSRPRRRKTASRGKAPRRRRPRTNAARRGISAKQRAARARFARAAKKGRIKKGSRL